MPRPKGRKSSYTVSDKAIKQRSEAGKAQKRKIQELMEKAKREAEEEELVFSDSEKQESSSESEEVFEEPESEPEKKAEPKYKRKRKQKRKQLMSDTEESSSESEPESPKPKRKPKRKTGKPRVKLEKLKVPNLQPISIDYDLLTKKITENLNQSKAKQPQPSAYKSELSKLMFG